MMVLQMVKASDLIKAVVPALLCPAVPAVLPLKDGMTTRVLSVEPS